MAFWTEMMQHGTYDEFWQARDLRRHLKNIKPAVMTVGRLVRRRGSVRRAEHVQVDREEQPRRATTCW